MAVRDSASPDVRSLIDSQIVTTAHRRLGDLRQRILLSLPPERLSKGALRLGTVLYEAEKWPLGLSTTELMQNLAIFGRSGAGKTNVAFLLLEQLTARRIPWLFLDWKRTARHMIPALPAKVNVYTPGRALAPFPFNPFLAPPGLEQHVYVNHLIDVIAEAYTLGDGARSVLQKAITACLEQERTPPTVQRVLDELDRLPDNHRIRGWKISATRALQSLAFSRLIGKDVAAQESFMRGLLSGRTVIELDALDQGGKKFLIPILMLWLYHVRLSAPVREKLELAVFVEEAHHVLFRSENRSKESLMNMLLRQCREIGIGMIVIDQHPHLIASAAQGNTYTSICLNLKDPADIHRAAGLSLVEDEDKRLFSMLPVGHAIVKLQDRWRQPFLVRFPLVHVKKGSVTDERLSQLLRGNSSRTGRFGADAGEFGGDQQVPVLDEGLNDESLAFLEDVLRHCDDGVRVRYQRLGMSVRRGMALRDALVRRGFLDIQEVKLGRYRKILLRVRRKARELLGITGDDSLPVRESLAHEFWKRFYAKRYEEQGYRVQLEAPRPSGRVDVLAVKGTERVAIEVETGKSDVVANVKADLRAGFDRVVVVATDEGALERVERELGAAGLLIDKRTVLSQARS